MLYCIGYSSYTDVGERVGARNIVRYIFNEPNDICVLGVKPEYLTPIINDGN